MNSQLNKNIIQKNFSRAVESYDDYARLQRRVAHELLSRAGELSGYVLDIGCGTGVLADSYEGDAKFVNLDWSFPMCQATGGIAINADAENLPFADESFDNIISSLTIQWAGDLKQFFAETARVLKPGAKFNLSTFTTGTFRELKESFAFLDEQQHILDFHSSMQIFAAAKMAGLENLQIHAQTITYQYSDLFEILYMIKNIGATYPLARGNGLKGKKYFEKLENIYKAKFGDSGKLPLSWEILYVSGKA